jgi:hypothetical protein
MNHLLKRKKYKERRQDKTDLIVDWLAKIRLILVGHGSLKFDKAI